MESNILTVTFKTHLLNFWDVSRGFTVNGNVFMLLRIYLGAFYIMTGTNKVFKGDLGLGYMDDLVHFVTGVVLRAKPGGEVAVPGFEAAAPDFYVLFLESVVLPNPEIFTYLVAWGETLLGFALLFGVSVRLAGFMGAFMAGNYLLASGRGLFLPSFDALLAYSLLTLALARAGRTFGIDTMLAKWKPKSWFW